MKVEQNEKIIVSACLAGKYCRYDGKANTHPLVKRWVEEGKAIPVCPEQLGGLSTPRVPAEIQKHGDELKVITRSGIDVTTEYKKGAEAAFALAKKHGCTKAILKAKSPSCGCGLIYDGNFSRTLIPGNGITAHLLKANGIEVYTEERLTLTITEKKC